MWDEDDFNEKVQAFIVLDDQGSGSFQFSSIQRDIDDQEGLRDGQPAAEFSWEGGDGADGPSLSERGWAVLQETHSPGCFSSTWATVRSSNSNAEQA